MKLNRTHIILIMIYMILVGVGIKVLADKLPDSYTYTYNLSEFNLDAGALTEEGLLIDASSSFDGYFASLPVTTLQEGDYTYHISYQTDSDTSAHFTVNANQDFILPLPAGQDVVENTFTVSPYTDKFRIRFHAPTEGTFCIKEVSVSSPKPLTNDLYYYIVLLAIFGIAIPCIYTFIRYRKISFDKEQTAIGILFVAAIIIVNLPIFYDYLWFGVDTRAQLLRMEGIRIALRERQIPAIINPNYCNEFGELGCMYPGLFLYIPALLRSFGVSMMAAYKSAHVLINVITLFVMYGCIKDVTGSRKGATIATLLYCFSPHRMYIMYFGGQALGMGIAMIFFPLLYVGLYHIFLGNHKKWYLLVIGISGIFQSHILSSVLALIVCVIFALCYLKRLWQNNRWLSLCKSVVLAFFLNLYAIVPFIYYYKTGLALDNLERNFLHSLISIKDILIGPRGLAFGLCIAIVVIWAFLHHNKATISDSSERKLLLSFVRFLLIASIITHIFSSALFPWAPIYALPFIHSILTTLQFPERFLLISMPAIAMVVGILSIDFLENTKSVFKKIVIIICTFICCAGVYMEFSGFFNCGELLTSSITGDINSRLQEDYLPAGTETSFYTSNVLVGGNEESFTVNSYHKDGTRIMFAYTCSTDDNYVEFPLFYYDGYKAIDENGQPLLLEKGNQNKVRVYTEKTDTEKQITVYFSTFWYFKLCVLVSVLSCFILIFIMIRSRYRKSTIS